MPLNRYASFAAIILFYALVLVQPALAAPHKSPLVEGRFGRAIDLSTDARYVSVPLGDAMERLPVTFQCWVRVNSLTQYNIVLAAAPKSGNHWEIYTTPRDGKVSLYVPQLGDFPGAQALPIGQWHFVALRIGPKSIDLYVNGQVSVHQDFASPLHLDQSPLLVGSISGESLRLDGSIDDLVINRSTSALEGFVPDQAAVPDAVTIALFHFDEDSADPKGFANAAPGAPELFAQVSDNLAVPTGNRFLDEAQDEAFARSTLHGDAQVEAESVLPVHRVKAVAASTAIGEAPAATFSLNGAWRLKESAPRHPASLEKKQLAFEESEGVKNHWFEAGYDRSTWRMVDVPTTVQNALLMLGELPDPLYGANTWDELHQHGWPQDFPWHHRKTRIEQQDWWFAKTFTLPADWSGKSLRLCFDGVDYAASFYLNGKPLGFHAGMFGGPTYDVTGLLRFDAPNELVVRVETVPDSWFGVLKGSPGWGWHYGHLISMGIWRSVEVQCVPEIAVSAPFVRTQSITDGEAVLDIEYYVDNRRPNPTPVTVHGTLAGLTFTDRPQSFTNRLRAPSGRTRYATQITVRHPKLWWPLNYGDQDRYELRLDAADGRQNAVPDVQRAEFGIRTIEMRPLAGAHEATDYRWQFVVNGVPMFIKGANWCWTDPLLQQDPDKYEHILELARRGGIQMFRSWGGGIIESDIFYRLCDQKGLMVYQEFPYCWGPPDFPNTDPAVLDQQVSAVVKRLRNHPSLVMWGGGNENTQIAGSDEGLFLVGRRCRQYDRSRPFHRTSPWGGSLHNWGVFHNGLPIDSGFVNQPSPWYGEFGLPSMTSRAESLKYLPEEEFNTWPPALDDGAILGHLNQFSCRDLIKTMRYADYGPIKSWDQYAEYSQMAQGDEIRFAANFQRAGSYLNKGGLWFYKMTDLFPGHAWAVVGFYGEPKLSYYRAKQVYQPQAAYAHARSFDWPDHAPFEAELHVNNDSNKPLENATVTAVVYGSDLIEQWRREDPVARVAPGERIDLEPIRVQIPPEKMKPFLLAVALRRADGSLASDQWYWFNYKAKTDKVRELEALDAWSWPEDRLSEAFAAYAALPEARLLSLPQTRLVVQLRSSDSSAALTITNEGDRPAFNVLIDGFPYDYGNYLDDNSFCLYPHQTRTIRMDLSGTDRSLKDLSVHAWNAPASAPH